MKLKIEKFAKIKEADIELNGITVVAGYNDTGKSTIGKVLYSIFNSLKSIDLSVKNKRKHDIESVCSEIVSGIYGDRRIFMESEDDNGEFIEIGEIIAKKIIKFNGDLSIDKYREILNEVITDEDKKGKESVVEDYVETSYSKISAIKNTSQDDLYEEIIERYFSNIFYSQINNCYFPDNEAVINLNIKEKDIKLIFNNNKCSSIDLPFNILHEAFLIDDPFILDNAVYARPVAGMGIREQLVRRIMFQRENLMDGIFDAVASKESLKKINDILDKVVNGEIINSKEGMQFIANNHDEPISVVNLSAGLKGFVLIKTLLEKGILKEKDVLILDEPEIHMHTQWQLIYAEIIVALQKYFDMTILVTTHSSHFLQAIEFFSKKYKIQANCNYYLSKNEGDGVVFQNMTSDTYKIHSEMVEPSIILDRLEEELEDEQDNEL